MPKALSTLPIGAKVKDTGTTHLGEEIIFIVAAKNHTGYPANSATLLSEKILRVIAFDAKEPSNSNTNRRTDGNNRYALSNVRRWLNSSAISWYAAQHSADTSPSASNLWNEKNPYNSAHGFMRTFTSAMQNAILNTTIRVVIPTVDGGGSEYLTDKIFLLSRQEVGHGAENSIAEGAEFAYFSQPGTRPAYPTASAVSSSDSGIESYLNVNAAFFWWLRTPLYSASHRARHISANGNLGDGSAFFGGVGIRPALNVSSGTLVSDSPDGNGVYTIIWNQAPTPPPSISTPDSIRSGQNADIQWAASMDPESNPITYELQCSVNAGAYSNIYTGAATSYAHPVTTAMNSVQYRVRAKDSHDAYSGYTTGPVHAVIHNVDPTISGSDTNLGVVMTPPSTSFTVDDQDTSDDLTVDLRIDDITVETIHDAVRQQTYTWELTAQQFFALDHGSHTMKIIVTDTLGNQAVRTITFQRVITSVDFKLQPITTDAMAEKILISLRYNADPQDVIIRVCNNALDASPAWETANQGLKHIFANNGKTADSWAVGVWVTITPTAEFPQVNCLSLSGSYI